MLVAFGVLPSAPYSSKQLNVRQVPIFAVRSPANAGHAVHAAGVRERLSIST
jgi:hypothetical protein